MTIPINFSLLLPGLDQIYSDIRSFSNSKSTVSLPAQNTQKNVYVQADWLTPEQKAAYQSGDQEAIRQADEAALNQAIEISKASFAYDMVNNALKNSADIPNNPALSHGNNAKKTKIENYAQHRTATRANTNKLKNWFANHNCQVIQSSGSSNNCAIHSLLKLATRDYAASHVERAVHYKKWLIERFKGAQHSAADQLATLNSMLLADSTHMEVLINQINADYGANMRVNFVMGDAEGRPYVTRCVGDGNNDVVIFDQGGHFEPVIASKDISFLSSSARVIAA